MQAAAVFHRNYGAVTSLWQRVESQRNVNSTLVFCDDHQAGQGRVSPSGPPLPITGDKD